MLQLGKNALGERGVDMMIGVSQRPRWVPSRASLYLDFMADRAFAPGSGGSAEGAVIVSRAGSALMLGPDGYQSFTANTLARIDGVGAQVVPASTNRNRSSGMTGAVVGVVGSGGALPTGWTYDGAPHGFSVEVLEIGTARGLPSLTLRLTGTSVSRNFVNVHFSGSGFTPTTEGSIWTASVFCELLAGAWTPVAHLNGYCRNPNYAGVAMNGDLTLGVGYMPRIVASGAMLATTTATDSALIFSNIPLGSNIDLTIRIACPQYENLPFATPPNPSSTDAAVSRPGDILSASVPDGGRAFVFEFDLLEPVAGSSVRYLLSWSDGSGNNRYSFTLTAAGVPTLDVGNGGYVGGRAGPAVSLGRNTFFGVAAPNFIQLGRVGTSDGASRTDLVGAGPLNRLGFGGTGYNTSGNSFIHAHRFTERPVTDFSTPADAFAWAKSVAQGWAA